MFSMTRNATEQILAAAERSDAAGMALRIAARQGAGGSIDYGMGFDAQREQDAPLQFGALTVLIAPPSQPLLQDTVLDFVEVGPGEFGFVFAEAAEAVPEAPAPGCGSGGCSECGG